MKTPLTIALTALITWFACNQLHSIQNYSEKVFFQSGILYPLIKATESIESDLKEERDEKAQQKIEAMGDALDRLRVNFESFEAIHLGDLAEHLKLIDQNQKIEPATVVNASSVAENPKKQLND